MSVWCNQISKSDFQTASVWAWLKKSWTQLSQQTFITWCIFHWLLVAIGQKLVGFEETQNCYSDFQKKRCCPWSCILFVSYWVGLIWNSNIFFLSYMLVIPFLYHKISWQNQNGQQWNWRLPALRAACSLLLTAYKMWARICVSPKQTASAKWEPSHVVTQQQFPNIVNFEVLCPL